MQALLMWASRLASAEPFATIATMSGLARWIRALLTCTMLWASQAAVSTPALAADVVVASPATPRVTAPLQIEVDRKVARRDRDRNPSQREKRFAIVPPIRPAGAVSNLVLVERPYLRHCVLLR
jgi:hypothetical protein